MRRLFGVLILAAIMVAVAWVVTPLVAAGLVQAAVVGAGLDAATTRVQVEADPPLALLLGHADAGRIQSRGIPCRGSASSGWTSSSAGYPCSPAPRTPSTAP